MNDFAKTAIFAVVAAVICIAAVFADHRPKSDLDSPVGRVLFSDFTDASAAKRMQIVSFDQKNSDYRNFEVKQLNGVWVLPSQQDYPADAQNRIGEAANAMIGIKVLDVVSKNPGDQELYGVVEPQPDSPDAPTKGVGKLVVIQDDSGKNLARLVVGKAEASPKGAGANTAGASNLRFAREPGQDPIYRVAIDSDKFSSRFRDWIEPDLLKVKAYEIERATIEDYSIEKGLEQQGGMVRVVLQPPDQRMLAKLAYNDKDNKWELLELKDLRARPEDEGKKDEPQKDGSKKDEDKKADTKADDGADAKKNPPDKEPVKTEAAKKDAGKDEAAKPGDDKKSPGTVDKAGNVKLGPDEELNTKKLNDMRTALGDLKIVGVLRKPAGLSKNLKVDQKLAITRENLTSLQNRGFYVYSQQGDIYSDQGEIHCTAKDGVQYVLRFGEIAPPTADESDDNKDDASADKKDADKSADKKADEKTTKGANRYLFVMARVNEDVIAKPNLLTPPPQPSKEEAKPEKSSDEKTPAKDEIPTKTPATKAADAKKTDAAKSDAKKPADAKKTDAAKKDEAATKDEAKKDEAKKDDKSKADDPDKKADDAKKAAEKAQHDYETQRKFVEDSNKKAQADYDAKVEAAKKHANELNVRFADWYYVVSDDVYRKIHLSRDDIIKKKDAAAPSAQPPAGGAKFPGFPGGGFPGLPPGHP